MYKKLLLAITMPLLFATSSYADSISLSTADRTTSNGSKVTMYGLKYVKSIGESTALDVGIAESIARSTDAVTNRTEVGITQKLPAFKSITPSVRLATGMKNKSGTEGFGYYAAQMGLGMPITDKVSIGVAYRYRDSFDTSFADRSDTYRGSVSYKFTKQDKVTLGYDDLRGDGENTQWRLQYTRSF